MSLYQFDLEYYRTNYSDLSGFDDGELEAHYHSYGISEGRVASPYQLRENFVGLIPNTMSRLEIGPFTTPIISGKDSYFFDVLDTEALKERANKYNLDPSQVPKIHFGNLSEINRKFHSIVSSHCIEHQPDFIRHLIDVSALLKPGGAYYLLVPDKFYCFDHFIESTNIGDVLQAHREERKLHTLASVIEHRALTTHNDPLRHWQNDNFDAGWRDTIAARTKEAIEEFDASRGQYIDVHAWQFTPDNFREITGIINKIGFSDLIPEVVNETPYGRNEFTAILRKQA